MGQCGLRKDTSPDYFAKGVISSSDEADYARHSIQRCIDLCTLTFPSRLIFFIVGLCICQLEAGVDLCLRTSQESNLEKQPGRFAACQMVCRMQAVCNLMFLCMFCSNDTWLPFLLCLPILYLRTAGHPRPIIFRAGVGQKLGPHSE